MQNNNTTREEILKALNWRYATKVFDKNKKVSEEDMHTILESARLSPSSNGIEMWKFIVVENEEIRAKLRAVGYDQSKITDASHLIVVAYRTDAEENLSQERIERVAKIQNQDITELTGNKNSLDNSVTKKAQNGTLEAWIKAQAYIPLGLMMETAALLHIDNCAMEGFQPDKVDEILNLKNENLKSTTMLALGYRGEDDFAKKPKVRRAFDEVVKFIK